MHLRDLCDLVAEQVDPLDQPDAVYVGLEHVASGRFVRDGEGTASNVRSAKYVFAPGDILYGKLRPYLDKAVLAQDVGICTTELLVLRPKEGVDPRFVVGVVHAPTFIEHAVAGTTGVQHPRTSWSHISNFNLPAVNAKEQTKTADVLWQAHDAITANEVVIEVAIALKRAAMRTLFTRGLRGEAQKETEIGPVPESWEQTTLGDLCQKFGGALQTGPFGSQLHKDDYQETGVAVINPTHMDAGRIVHDNVPRISEEDAHRLQRHRLEGSDILFARRGEIGRQALVTKLEEGWLCGTGCFLARVRSISIDNRFLSYQFSTEASVSWLRTHAAGAIMPNLNNVILGHLPVFCPGVLEQCEIVAILEAIDRKTELHRRKCAVLDELFKALLHKLMTGEIRIASLDLSALRETTSSSQTYDS